MVATERTVVPADSAAATVVIGVGSEGATTAGSARVGTKVGAGVEYAVVERETETVESRVATMVTVVKVEEMEGEIAPSI